MRRTALIASALITAATLAGCASTATSSPPVVAASTIPGITPAAASPSSSCSARFTSWRDSGGLADLQAVTGDLGTVSTAAEAMGGDITPGTEAALQQAAASMQSDTETAQADLPPACVPGLRRNVSAALTDYNRAAVEAGQSVTAASSGSYDLATSDVIAAGKAMQAGSRKIVKATAAMKAFGDGT